MAPRTSCTTRKIDEGDVSAWRCRACHTGVFESDGLKRRPVVVLRDVGDADVLVAPITSQASRVAYDVNLADWPQEGLKLPSVVRSENLATVEKSTVIRVLGHLSPRDWSAVESNLAVVFREIVAF